MFIAWEVKRSKKEVKTINCKNAHDWVKIKLQENPPQRGDRRRLPSNQSKEVCSEIDWVETGNTRKVEVRWPQGFILRSISCEQLSLVTLQERVGTLSTIKQEKVGIILMSVTHPHPSPPLGILAPFYCNCKKQ